MKTRTNALMVALLLGATMLLSTTRGNAYESPTSQQLRAQYAEQRALLHHLHQREEALMRDAERFARNGYQVPPQLIGIIQRVHSALLRTERNLESIERRMDPQGLQPWPTPQPDYTIETTPRPKPVHPNQKPKWEPERLPDWAPAQDLVKLNERKKAIHLEIQALMRKPHRPSQLRELHLELMKINEEIENARRHAHRR